MIALTPKQLERAKFINQHIIDNDNFPTHKQISEEFNIPTSASMTLITTLYAKGWITQQKTAQSYMRTPAMKERLMEL
jgi:DNA-binding IclR family transcriptional regulator